MIENKYTDFGFEKILRADKKSRVSSIFSSVANHYDLMNDLMSLGIHRIWKRFAVHTSGVKQGDKILDVAGGTGNMSRLYYQRTGEQGTVVLSDINADMLKIGRNRMIDKNILKGMYYLQANAENLPVQKNYFDCVNISFGLRNVTDKLETLNSMYEATRYGGCVVILEFSKVIIPLLDKIYDQYSFNIIPWLGRMVAHDENSYRYLVESIRMHPDQEQLKKMIETAGYRNVEYHNLSGGIAAVHKGYKI